MSLSSACRHNQSLVISAVITIICFGGIAACHLTQAQKKEIIAIAATTAEAAAEGSPTPWSKIGLLIGTILGGGSVVDNRRKDVLIKRLKTENANQTAIISGIANGNVYHPTTVPPLRNS